jgi:uncharacterized membrane protein YfcA
MRTTRKTTVFQLIFLILGTLLSTLAYYFKDVRFYFWSPLFIGISLGIYIGASTMGNKEVEK